MLNLPIGGCQLALGKQPLRRYRDWPTAANHSPEHLSGDQWRILVVEDEMFVAQNASMMLESAGYEVVGIAVTADDAVEKAKGLEPDLVLMDIRLLGERDGVEAALEIRQRFGIRSLFLTAYGDDETQARAAEAEPVGFLSKPFTKETLLAGIKRFFE